MKKINVRHKICNYEFIMINENNDIMLFDYSGDNKIKRIFNSQVFLNTKLDININAINSVLSNYNMICVETRKDDNIFFYDIIIDYESVNENKQKDLENKQNILQALDYDFILHNTSNGSFNVLKYNNHKRIKKEIKEIVDKSSSISFLNMLLHKYKLKCYLVNTFDNIYYYEIVSFTEYNKREKKKTDTLDLSDLD